MVEHAVFDNIQPLQQKSTSKWLGALQVFFITSCSIMSSVLSIVQSGGMLSTSMPAPARMPLVGCCPHKRQRQSGCLGWDAFHINASASQDASDGMLSTSMPAPARMPRTGCFPHQCQRQPGCLGTGRPES